MAMFVKKIGKYRVYELEPKECKEYGKLYPTFVCWYNDDDCIGIMSYVENETRSIDEMETWCLS